MSFSAVLAGIKEIREVMAEAERLRRTTGRRTIVFIDEIHRFNKAQQDAFLPRVEAGDIVLIGATTENPSFEVNAALLSRSKVFVLRGLTTDEVAAILDARARRRRARPRRASRSRSTTTRCARSRVYANGDARSALNLLELSVAAAPVVDGDRRRRRRPRRSRRFSGARCSTTSRGEEHYNLISALHKSMRNSDPDAAVYWLARMLEAGEDPLYIARRLVRFASEDIGNADPQALTVAVAAKDAVHFIGMPEGNTALAQAAIYLATAPKSNAVYEAYNARGRGRAPRRRRAGAAAPAQRADAADEGARLRQGLPVRARRAGRGRRHVVPAAGARGTEVLRADRARVREGDQAAAGRLGGDQEAAPRVTRVSPHPARNTATPTPNSLAFGPSGPAVTTSTSRIHIPRICPPRPR